MEMNYQISQKNIRTVLHEDSECRKEIVETFIDFARDYYHTQHFTQFHTKNGLQSEVNWVEFVCTLAEQSVTQIYIRKVSRLFVKAYSSKERPRSSGSKSLNPEKTPSKATNTTESIPGGKSRVDKTDETPSLCHSGGLRCETSLSNSAKTSFQCKINPTKVKLSGTSKCISRGKNCEHTPCSKTPRFGYVEEKRIRMCFRHALPGMLRLSFSELCDEVKRCCIEDCKWRAAYNYQGKTKEYCIQHKLTGMINVKRRSCGVAGCQRAPTFKFSIGAPAKLCFDHKMEGMLPTHQFVAMNPKKKRCEHALCKKVATFKLPTETKARFCSEHKIEGMITPWQRCNFLGCKRYGYFNYKGEKKAMFCTIHKLEGMCNVLKPRCEYNNCEVKPVFNYSGEKHGRFCRQHKIQGMMDVVNKKCEHPGCEKNPFFNFEGLSLRRFCATHRLQGMVNVR